MSTKTKFYKLLTGLMLLSSVGFAQPRLLEYTLNHLTGGGSVPGSGFGPRITNHLVSFDKDRQDNGSMDLQSANPEPIVAPFVTSTFSFQNQQYTGFTYGAGTINGFGTSNAISSGLVFGAGPSNATGAPPGNPNIQQATPLNSYDVLGAFNGGGGPRNGMFMSNPANAPVANYPGASGTGLDAEALYPAPATDANGGVQLFTAAQRMFDLNNPAGTANRYYYGDLVITFNKYLQDPVVHIAGLGGSYRYFIAGGNSTNPADWRSTFFSTELELVTSAPAVSLVKMAGNQFMTVSGKNILNNALTPNGESIDVGVVPLPNWNNFGAATGSIKISGIRTNILRFKVYLRGSDANALPNNFNWSAPGAASGGSRDPLTGDIWMVSVSTTWPTITNSCLPGDPNCITLPATGVNLAAALNGNDVALSWKTQSEINSNYFVIERSTDGINFNTIGNKTAAGNSSAELSYGFSDPNMNVPAYYYRLKLVDIDGHFTYSNIAVVRKSGSIKGVRVFPNPVTENMRLEFSNAKGNYKVSVFNQTGQEVITEKVTIASTVQYITINRNNLASGSYLVRVTNTENGEMLFADKIILQ
jgi:hypothetical protein